MPSFDTMGLLSFSIARGFSVVSARDMLPATSTPTAIVCLKIVVIGVLLHSRKSNARTKLPGRVVQRMRGERLGDTGLRLAIFGGRHERPIFECFEGGEGAIRERPHIVLGGNHDHELVAELQPLVAIAPRRDVAAELESRAQTRGLEYGTLDDKEPAERLTRADHDRHD